MAKKKNNGKRTKIKNNKTEKNSSQQKETTIEPALDVKNLKYETTADIKVSKNIINQVVGQEEAVHIIKKAAEQRRHVLLIGEPGTGKSMLGLALAELLPKEKLVDTVSFPNPDDENQPLIRTVPAGQGRDLVFRSKIESSQFFKTQNFIMFIIVIFSIMFPYWLWYTKKISDIIFAAFIISSFLFLLGFMVFMNMNKRAIDPKIQSPKVIVDNFKKKQAPFMDATGAHAGALLGDVLHDPFQCYSEVVTICDGKKDFILGEKVNYLLDKHKNNILRKKDRNYEAIHLPKNELFVLGETNGLISPVEVLSCNRHDHAGEMIKLTTSENKEVIVTPEHKIAVNKDGNTSYVKAKDIKKGDAVITKSENIIIDEEDIINTYDKKQQEQCKLYYQYLDIKRNNPTWGYKRIATAMNQNIGKTRWWHAKKHIPVPIQTANWLKEKGLLPFKADNPKAPLIAKVLGATFGDGGIFENLNGIFLSSSNYHDTEEFSTDLQKIFGKQIVLNAELREGGEYGHSWCLTNTNRNVIRFFLALGAPKGNKVHKELIIPQWIKLREEFKDEFYGSLFGGELGVSHKYKKTLPCVEFIITGLENLETNRIQFLNEIIDYLSSKYIEITDRKIDVRKVKTKNGSEGNRMYRFIISQHPANIDKFIERIKINYCNLKKYKLQIAIDREKRNMLLQYLDLRAKGLGAESIMKKLEIDQKYLYRILKNTKINMKDVEAVA